MTVRVSINGFGRIGRLILRAIYESGRKDLKVVTINNLASIEASAHLLKYDTVHGRFPFDVEVQGDKLIIDGDEVLFTQQRDPSDLPLGDLDVDVAMECTGIFRDRAGAQKLLSAGAQKVLISAPAKDEDITVVYGVNDDKLTADHKIVSNASCTTNCLAPVAYVLNETIGIDHGFMTTIHSYTGDQCLVDTAHSDLHRARGGATNMIPTSTGAAKAVGLVLPELNGKLDGVSMRVPTPNVSVIDLNFVAKRGTSVAEINEAIQTAANGNKLKGILGCYKEPLVSSDFNHDARSSIFALNETRVMEGTFARILSWYDNEWGFSNRMADTAVKMASLK